MHPVLVVNSLDVIKNLLEVEDEAQVEDSDRWQNGPWSKVLLGNVSKIRKWILIVKKL